MMMIVVTITRSESVKQLWYYCAWCVRYIEYLCLTPMDISDRLGY